jgi:hypothetical protein
MARPLALWQRFFNSELILRKESSENLVQQQEMLRQTGLMERPLYNEASWVGELITMFVDTALLPRGDGTKVLLEDRPPSSAPDSDEKEGLRPYSPAMALHAASLSTSEANAPKLAGPSVSRGAGSSKKMHNRAAIERNGPTAV